MIILCAVDRGSAEGRLLQKSRKDALKRKSKFSATLVVALAMVNDYSSTAPVAKSTSGNKGVAFVQEAAGTNTSTKRLGKETLDGRNPAQKGDSKPIDKSGVTCNRSQK